MSVLGGLPDGDSGTNLDDYLTVHADGSAVLALEHPFSVEIREGGGEPRRQTINEIRLARPKGRHIKRLSKAAGDDEMDRVLEIAVDLADGDLTMRHVDDLMDAVDALRLAESLGRFFPRPKPSA